MNSLPIVVVGAGIAGLATAKLLRYHDFEVVVLERESAARTQGYGISLRSWAYEPLVELLGLEATALVDAVATDRFIGGKGIIDMNAYDAATGCVLIDMGHKKPDQVFRANRTALRDWLSKDVEVRYGQEVVKIARDGSINIVELSSGMILRAAIVIAADGIFSSVRTQLLSNFKPKLIPSTTYLCEQTLPRSEYEANLAPHMNGKTVKIGMVDNSTIGVQIVDMKPKEVNVAWTYIANEHVNLMIAPSAFRSEIVIDINQKQRRTKLNSSELISQIATLDLAMPFKYFFTPDKVSTSDTCELYHWTMHAVHIREVDFMRATLQSNVILVGDAAHGMPIFAGEGGNHALLDAVELVKIMIQMRVSTTSRVGETGISAEEVRSRLAERYLSKNMGRWDKGVEDSITMLGGLCRSMNEWRLIAKTNAT